MTIVIRDDGVFTFAPFGGLVVFLDGRLVVVNDGAGAFVITLEFPEGNGCWKGNSVPSCWIGRVVDGPLVSITVDSVVAFIGRYVVVGAIVVVVVIGVETLGVVVFIDLVGVTVGVAVGVMGVGTSVVAGGRVLVVLSKMTGTVPVMSRGSIMVPDPGKGALTSVPTAGVVGVLLGVVVGVGVGVVTGGGTVVVVVGGGEDVGVRARKGPIFDM